MTAAATGFSGSPRDDSVSPLQPDFALVSAVPRLRNFSGAIRAVSLLIKFGLVARMLLQNFAWSKFIFSSGQPFQFLDDSLQSKVFPESQRPTTEWREAGPQNHSVVRVLRGIDDFLLHAPRGLIHHQEDKPVRERLFVQPQAWVAMPIRRDIWSLRALRLTV